MKHFHGHIFFDGGDYSFEMLHQGREGEIVYKEGNRSLKIYWEFSAAEKMDILVGPVNLMKWKLPTSEAIPFEKQREILTRLRTWFLKEGLISDIDLPTKIEYEDTPCMWSDCGKKRIKGSAYCLNHLDLTSLRK
jgi:hypothetical protein